MVLPQTKKTLIRILLGVIVLLDLGLAGINWKIASSPHTPESQLKFIARQHALLAADVARAQKIRENLSATEKESDGFYHDQFRPVGSGYSALEDDLGTLARNAGIRAEGLSFRQQTPDKRGVTEVEIGTTVDGDYASVVRFIDSLERSESFYILDSLSLAPGSAGQLKLNLQLRTFFRS
jgi:Type II secretion system (T2SS), protein M subtype b